MSESKIHWVLHKVRIIRNIIEYGIPTVFLLSGLLSIAQTDGTMDVSVAEKIYLQLSSGVYAADQEIWFKAIVVDSEDHLPSNISGVLYVDLVNPSGQIIDHKLIKLTSGFGSGSFELNKNYPIGRYLIRAYTQWNRNFGNDFIFESYVNIVAPKPLKDEGFLDALTLVEQTSGDILLTGKISPFISDALDKKQVPVYLNFKQGQDTLGLKKKNGTYTLTYKVPKDMDWVTLTLGNVNSCYSETIVLRKGTIDVQFFPESGQLVHGFPNKIGFKALGMDGKGTMVHGAVFDEKGQQVTDFSSNSLGMGTFTMQVDSTKAYHAKVFVPNDSTGTSTHRYPLPRVAPEGSIVSLSRAHDKLWIRVFTNKLEGKIHIKVSCRGKDYFLMEGPLQNGFLMKDFPFDELPGGIIVFTLMDGQKRPVAERLFFNYKEEEVLNIAMRTDKKLYKRRERTKLNMHIPGLAYGPKNASVSVLVMNKAHFKPGLINTIRSYFLLDSEIRGGIEAPDYYFDEQTSNRYEELDALLLTQGWRNYKYPIKRKGNTFMWPQRGIEVKGVVQVERNKQRIFKNMNVGLATFGKESKFYTSAPDSLGRFDFLLDDDYGTKMQFLLSTVDSKGKRTNHKIHLNTVPHPKVAYGQKPILRELDTVIKAVVKAREERIRTKAVFDSLYGVTQLDEVVVSDYFLTPERAERYKKFGKPDVIITGDEIRDKEKEWSYGLYSILLFNYGDQITIERFPDGFMLAHIVSGRNEPTLLMVYGKLLEKHQYDQVPHMSPKIVERVELIKYAKFFKSRYLNVFPRTNPLKAPSQGHIISITTRAGVGMYAPKHPNSGTLKGTVDLFSPTKQFYAPKYDRSIPSQEDKPDLRSLIHWEPLILVDRKGNASTSFYNGDVKGKYIIVIEAISEDGRIGYGTMEYSVEEPSR